VAITTAYARIFLRSLCWQREATGTPLIELLRCTAQARLDDTATGQTITGSSANGASVSFATPGGRALTPTDLVELCSHLLDLYDAAVVALGEEASDADLCAWMLDRITDNRRTVADFSGVTT